MSDFSIPPKQPLPPPQSSQTGQGPIGLPPKHKIKPEPSKLETSQSKIESNAGNKIEELSEAEFQALIEEELPVIPDKPLQCDWHLGAMLSGNYPDPFSLPALQIAQQSLIHDMAALMQAIGKAGEEASALTQ